MAQMRQQTIPYFEGMNTYVSDLLKKDSDVNLLINGHFPKIGVVQKRGGITFKGDRQGTGDILGLHSLYTGLSDGSGGYKKHFYQVSTVSGTTAIREYNSGTNQWDSLSGAGTGLTASEQYEFANFLNYAFVVNPSNAPRTIDGSNGTTVSTTTNLNGAPAYAQHIETYFNRVYMADCTIGSKRYPSRVYFSSLPFGPITTVKGDQNNVTTSFDVADNRYLKDSLAIDVRAADGTAIVTNKAVSGRNGRYEVEVATLGGVDLYSGDEVWINGTYQSDPQILWDDNEDWFAVGENDGEGINRVIRLGDYLVIFKPSSIWRYNQTSLINVTADERGVGAVSGKSVARAKSSIYFLSQFGFYQFSGSRLQDISGKIFDLVSDIDWNTSGQAVGWADNENYYCYVPTATIKYEDGSTRRTLTNVVFVYNLRQFAWSVYTNITAKNAASFIESGRTNYFIGGDDGYVYRTFNGFKDQTGASTYTEVPFELETKDYWPASLTEYQQFLYMYPLADLPNGVKVQAFIDGSKEPMELVPEPALKDDPRYLTFDDTAYGRKVKFKFSANTKTNLKINGFVLEYQKKDVDFEKERTKR